MSTFVHHNANSPTVTVPGYGKIAYQDHLPTVSPVKSADGKPLTLVCVHAAFANSTLWSRVFPLFTSLGYRVVAPDMPLGSHLYPMLADADLTPPGLGKLLSGFIGQAGLDNVVLVGSDTGGAICQMAITHHPTPRVTALVLADCDVYEHFPPPRFNFFITLGSGTPGLYHLRMTNWLAMSHTVRYLPQLCGLLLKHRAPGSPSDTILQRIFETGYNAPWDSLRDIKRVLSGVSGKYTVEAAKAKFGNFKGKALIAWCPEDEAFEERFVPQLVEDLGGSVEKGGKVTVVKIHDS
ncbi:hypothetical protein HDU93_002508 [Gonapodya sp. JEL0774]|nr:hypothetical protein HDU93_002508 [Gonapodya sp. JEL0774]